MAYATTLGACVPVREAEARIILSRRAIPPKASSAEIPRMTIVRILPSSSPVHAEVAFAYDREIVGVVRAMRTSRWLPRQKRWRLERTALDGLLAELERHGVTVDLRPLQPPPQGRHEDAR
jgi:hypothetical protein